MGLDGIAGQEHLPCDVGIGQPVGDKMSDLLLRGRQRLPAFGGPTTGSPSAAADVVLAEPGVRAPDVPPAPFAQVYLGTPVYSLDALRPGDLLFTAGIDGSPASPGHVGMYIGDGLVIQAPQTGEDVQLNPLSNWAPHIVAIRRIA